MEKILAHQFTQQEIEAARLAAYQAHTAQRFNIMGGHLMLIFAEISKAAGPIEPDDLNDEPTPAMRAALALCEIHNRANWTEVARIADSL